MTNNVVDDAPETYTGLVRRVLGMARAAQLRLEDVRGVAVWDTRKDQRIRALPEFALLRVDIEGLTYFADRFGLQNADRLTLQLVYEYFTAANELRLDPTILSSVWHAFRSELADPSWRTRTVANVRNFTAEVATIDLGDGVAIRERDFEKLEQLGFGPGVLKGLSDDWDAGFGSSSYVLIAESESVKEPSNLISPDMWLPSQKTVRALQALRLIGTGDVNISPIWVTRVARFNVGVGGTHRTGFSILTMGSQFKWTPELEPLYQRVYQDLLSAERDQYRKSPGNLALALRSFMSTYDRSPPGPDSQLLDSITPLRLCSERPAKFPSSLLSEWQAFWAPMARVARS